MPKLFDITEAYRVNESYANILVAQFSEDDPDWTYEAVETSVPGVYVILVSDDEGEVGYL